MDLDDGTGTQARFEEHVKFGSGARPCRPDQAIRGRLYRSVVGGGPQECRTAGGGDCAGANSGATPIAAALCGAGAVVRSGDAAPCARRALPSITRDEPIQAWIIDDTGFPKKGSHSVGVARQYCGQLGKQDNCQVAVSLSVATHQGSLPVAYRLYLPKEWADDAGRRATAGVPDDVCFQTKPEIALQQLREALADGVPPAPVLIDPAYGNNSKLRAGISELGLTYAAGILPTTMVWRPGEAPLPPTPRTGRGRPGKRMRRDATHQPVSAKTLALELAADAWQQIKWRDGSNTPLVSRFARWRVRPARDDAKRCEPAPEEWLLIEWPEGAAEPDHYWLATLPAEISLERMVDQAKLRWRIERDYLELKQEVGLGHYEGRGWRGFHHHASLCVAAYGFLISEKETIPPSGPARTWRGAQSALPDGYRPRGSAAAFATPHAALNRNVAYPPRAGFGACTATCPCCGHRRQREVAQNE